MRSVAIVAVVCGWLAGGCVTEPVAEETSSEVVSSGTCELSPTCAFHFLGGYVTPLQQQLGCSETYRYDTRVASRASLCPDSGANRARFTLLHLRFNLPGYCNYCLSVPAGQLLVIWVDDPGPGCPSGCAPG